MTREEAVTVLKAFMENPLFSDEHKAAFNIAIHDIKQRHDWDINNLILINKDNYESQEPKSEWEQDHAILKAYSDGADDVLDKIRAEIESIEHYGTNNGNDFWLRTPDEIKEDVLIIIDKYKGEVEPQESEEEDGKCK